MCEFRFPQINFLHPGDDFEASRIKRSNSVRAIVPLPSLSLSLSPSPSVRPSSQISPKKEMADVSSDNNIPKLSFVLRFCGKKIIIRNILQKGHISLQQDVYSGQVIWSKVLCLFCFEICTPEGRGGEKGGSSNFKTKTTEPLT